MKKNGTSAAPWPQLDGVRPKTSPSLVDDGRSKEDGEGRGGAKYNNGAQPVGRSPAGGREEGLDRPRKHEDDGFLSACDEVQKDLICGASGNPMDEVQ